MLNRIVLLTMFLVVLIVVFLFYSPRFLVHSDKPIKADAVVLFSGPGQKNRLEEARRLIIEGYARVLIIPHFGIVSKAEKNGDFESVAPELWRQDKQQGGQHMSTYPRYFESTPCRGGGG